MAHPGFVGRMTIDEYFAFEEHTPATHEYVDGEVFAMSGVTRRHSAIVGNVQMRLRMTARGTPLQGPCVRDEAPDGSRRLLPRRHGRL